MMKTSESSPESFERLERLAPLGYFAMGIGWITVSGGAGDVNASDLNAAPLNEMLVIANGSDWTPQPVTLHASHPKSGYEPLPTWFSEDYDHHMGVAVGDVTGNGYDDLLVAVFAGKNQYLAGGGVKLYVGGPRGLSKKPIWLARGFSATGIALGDLRGTGKRDIVVSCLSDSGTIQKPYTDHLDRFTGYARLLFNESTEHEIRFREVMIEHPVARGCGDVTLADVNGNGELDLVFAGQRTTVLYGPLPSTDSFENCPVWISEEEHPFSFSVVAFKNPKDSRKQLVASSRGLLSATQLKGRTLAEVETGILVHEPRENRMTCALQHLGGLEETRPEVPAGLAVTYDAEHRAHLIAGFLDARGRDIRGAALRVFVSSSDEESLFPRTQGRRLPGGGLMAGRVVARPRAEGPTSIQETEIEIGDKARRALSLPSIPVGELMSVRVANKNGQERRHQYTRTCNGTALCFTPPLPAGAVVSLSMRASEEVEIAAASSAAWPPAGASGLWHGRLRANVERAPQSGEIRKKDVPAPTVRQAG